MAGVLERVLQSPLVWMNLRKSRVVPASVPLRSEKDCFMQFNAMLLLQEQTESFTAEAKLRIAEITGYLP